MSSSPTESVAVTMPQMGVSVAEGTLIAWRVAVGDEVSADETVCEVSTDKIDTEVPAPMAGRVVEILVAVEDTVPVGAVLARISTADTPAGERVPRRPSAEAAAEPRGPFHSPLVRRIATDRGVDLSTLAGSGRNGRVTKQDVLAAADAVRIGAALEPPLHIESPYRPDPDPGSPQPNTPVPQTGTISPAPDGTLSRMRRQIGEHMKRSQQTAATCTSWIEADMTAVEAARRASGTTALAFVAAATVRALARHPELNATLEGEHHTVHQSVHLGIAVSLGENGLIVPVIRDAQLLSVSGLAVAIRDLAERARANRLSPDEVRGGTFTITNPGRHGTLMATPVINQPQVGILDFEAVIKRPVVLTGPDGSDAIGIRAMTILGLSWDHRALDGVLAAQFLAAVRDELRVCVK